MEAAYVIQGGGPAAKRLLKTVSRREFSLSLLGGFAGAVASHLIAKPPLAMAANLMSPPISPAPDFTIAIIPDPQYLAESCPDHTGSYYTGMMNWIVENRNLVLSASPPAFRGNIKGVVGVGDCINAVNGPNEESNAEYAWRILDKHEIAFITPPGNHDYADAGDISSRRTLGTQFKKGYFSAKKRSAVYGSGIHTGDGDMAFWVGSLDSSGANTAVKFVISGMKLLVIAVDFFAGNDSWSWANNIMAANPDCECYVTTHAWLTMRGSQYKRADGYGPDFYSMGHSPYSNSAEETWGPLGVNTWPNLFGIFSGHDIFPGTSVPGWYWQRVPVQSNSWRKQTVQQLFANSQQIDQGCSRAASPANGAGQTASVFLLSRRLALGTLEGRMISTHTRQWFNARAESYPGGTSWSDSETLLFSVPFAGLQPAT